MTVIISGDNGVSDVDGSAGTPAIRGTDANTGIFFPAADTIAFAEGGAEAMRIDSSGNVGIGTSSPASNGKLAVRGVQNITTYGDVSGHFSDTTTGSLYIQHSSGLVQLGSDTALSFGTGSSATERARITSGGKFLYGTTTQFTTGGFNPLFSIDSGAEAFAVFNINSGYAALVTRPAANHSYFAGYFLNSSGTKVGDINVGPSATAFTTSSDYRLKENIAPMSGALEKVAQLKPVTYTWKVDGSAGQGFIAHELQEVVPDCVFGEKDAVETYTDEDGNQQTRIKPQGIDTSFLVATLTAAIQELKAINDAQASRIETLEAKVAALEAR